MDEQPVVYTIPEAARILRVSTSLAYAMARTGELPSFRVRSRLLVRRSSLEAYMASQEQLQTDLQTTRANPFATRSQRMQKP